MSELLAKAVRQVTLEPVGFTLWIGRDDELAGPKSVQGILDGGQRIAVPDLTGCCDTGLQQMLQGTVEALLGVDDRAVGVRDEVSSACC